MAAYISSTELKLSFFSTLGTFSSASSSFRDTPVRFSSDSKLWRPLTMFSSRFSRLNHWRILLRALLERAILIQSRLGPWALWLVVTSTTSPFCSRWFSGTMRPLTLADTMWLPTAEWML